MKFSKALKRISALTLALFFALTVLVSCKNEKEPTVTEEGIVLLETPVVVADASEAYFKVVKSTASTNEINACLSALVNIADGFTLKYENAKEENNGNTDGEILLGNTCRTESKEAMNEVGYDGFSIKYANNKIVIAAHTPERLSEATAFLKEKLLRVSDGKLEYIGDYTYNSDAALMIGEGESIADYKIVCGDDNLYMNAQKIQKYIKDNLGAELEIIYDTKPKSSPEIVLGNAKRDIAKLTDSLNMGEGMIAVKDKDLLIAAKDMTTTVKAFEMFAEQYMSGIYTDSFNFKADLSVTESVFKSQFKESPDITGDADIRVMSFNVLCDLWGNEGVSGRDTTVAQTLLYYTPDVVGFQEMSSNWHNSVKKLLKATPYKLINLEHDHVNDKYGNLNFTPILYNSDTLTLIENDTKEFTETDLRYMKTMSYAYFEHKESGKKFVVLNTHFEAPDSSSDRSLVLRTKQAADIISFVKELETKYDCPIVVTGDFNSTEGKDKTGAHLPYWSLIDSGLHEAKYSADKIQRACKTWHELGSQVSTAADGSFDHIFGTERVKFTYFNTLVDKVLMNASDHCPIYADVKLN